MSAFLPCEYVTYRRLRELRLQQMTVGDCSHRVNLPHHTVQRHNSSCLVHFSRCSDGIWSERDDFLSSPSQQNRKKGESSIPNRSSLFLSYLKTTCAIVHCSREIVDVYVGMPRQKSRGTIPMKFASESHVLQHW